MYGKSNSKVNVQGMANHSYTDIELTAYEKENAVEIVKAMVQAKGGNPMNLSPAEIHKAELLRQEFVEKEQLRNPEGALQQSEKQMWAKAFENTRK